MTKSYIQEASRKAVLAGGLHSVCSVSICFMRARSAGEAARSG